MGIQRFYDFADVGSAMRRSEGQHLHLFRQVWGATEYDHETKEFFNKDKVLVNTVSIYKGPKAPSSNAEAGHTFEKHVGLRRAPGP